MGTKTTWAYVTFTIQDPPPVAGILLPLCVEIQEWDRHTTILFDTGDTVTAVRSILVKCVFAREEYNICLAR